MTILVDPGHGGEENGTVFEENQISIKEKELTLKIATKLVENLKKTFNGNVLLTRSMDRTVTLAERAEIAEKTKADVFISIHVNSNPDKNVDGIEIYYLDNNNEVAVEKVARTENKLLSGEDAITDKILTDLVIDQTVSKSKPLALHLKKKLEGGEIKSRRVKAGLFYVLALSKRPGVLIETGFLTNEKDRKLLNSDEYQEKFASKLSQILIKYFKQPTHQLRTFRRSKRSRN